MTLIILGTLKLQTMHSIIFVSWYQPQTVWESFFETPSSSKLYIYAEWINVNGTNNCNINMRNEYIQTVSCSVNILVYLVWYAIHCLHASVFPVWEKAVKVLMDSSVYFNVLLNIIAMTYYMSSLIVFEYQGVSLICWYSLQNLCKDITHISRINNTIFLQMCL